MYFPKTFIGRKSMVTKFRKTTSRSLTALSIVATLAFCSSVVAGEVDKGCIPAEHLSVSCKVLPWGSPVWDVAEAVASINGGEKLLWVDTRPASFFRQGSVRGAIDLLYDKSDVGGNEFTKAALEQAITKAGLPKDGVKIAIFCQGPECHRSYNAAFTVVTQWGYKPENVIWFRAGYPFLLKDIQVDLKLKCKT
jgi:hypothetical protein